MDRRTFKEIFEDYGECYYPQETVKSVQRCFVPYERKEQAIAEAALKRSITKRNAIDDVLDFFNCLKRSYCGYDYFFTDEMCEKVQNTIIRKVKLWPGNISNRRLCSFIFKALYGILNDSHFELYVCQQTWLFRRRYTAYVTDIILRKANERYEVINENSDFKEGKLFEKQEVQDFLMPTMYVGEDSSMEEEYYLLGKYSATKVKELSLDGRKIKTHKILSDTVAQNSQSRIVKKKGYVIVNHNSYGMPWNEALLREYYREGCLCAKSDAVILNLAGNGGGCSDYPARFYEGLNGNGENWFLGAYLPSPTDIHDEVKRYELDYPDTSVSSTYDGTVYVVMNKATASSAEMGVSTSYHLKNAVRVGSASLGCGTFGNCIFFQLSNSKIFFCFGHRLFYHENFEEGKGFMPDFWIDNANPVHVVEQYIKRKGK